MHVYLLIIVTLITTTLKSFSFAYHPQQANGGNFMIRIRKAEDRGPSTHSWLKSYHTFSFAQYYDPQHMGFESLRVINDDWVKAGAGFDTHPHKNMEIITYILEGELRHKDSMGNGSVIKPGEVQRMSAGSGITHSEFNHSQEKNVHLLQIWFLPDTKDIEPSYAQQFFPDEEKRGKFRLVASKTGRDNSLSLNQDVDMSVALVDNKEQATYLLPKGRKAWVHIARGSVNMNGHPLKDGDGAAIEDSGVLSFKEGNKAEIIIFDMKPMH